MAKKKQEEVVKHDHLRGEDFYETRSVARGRTDKICEHCGKIIPKGQPSDMHHFYPEFYASPTHPECSEAFLKSLL